jgi:hypothetical protein
MIRKFGFACLLGFAFIYGGSPASAFGPVNSLGQMNIQRDLVDASFFGRPYPYGYTGWGPCVRYEEVQTRWGWRLRRVRVCR